MSVYFLGISIAIVVSGVLNGLTQKEPIDFIVTAIISSAIYTILYFFFLQ